MSSSFIFYSTLSDEGAIGKRAMNLERISEAMRVLREKARRLGFGDKNCTTGWFDLRGCYPTLNEKVRVEAFLALNEAFPLVF